MVTASSDVHWTRKRCRHEVTGWSSSDINFFFVYPQITSAPICCLRQHMQWLQGLCGNTHTSVHTYCANIKEDYAGIIRFLFLLTRNSKSMFVTILLLLLEGFVCNSIRSMENSESMVFMAKVRDLTRQAFSTLALLLLLLLVLLLLSFLTPWKTGKPDRNWQLDSEVSRLLQESKHQELSLLHVCFTSSQSWHTLNIWIPAWDLKELKKTCNLTNKTLHICVRSVWGLVPLIVEHLGLKATHLTRVSPTVFIEYLVFHYQTLNILASASHVQVFYLYSRDPLLVQACIASLTAFNDSSSVD